MVDLVIGMVFIGYYLLWVGVHVSSANDIPEGTNKNKKSVKKFLYNKKARRET